MLPSAAQPLRPEPSVDLSGASVATPDEIKEFFGSISGEQRRKLAEALEILQKGPSGPLKLASSYILQGTDGEWGSYKMEVKINSDASGTVMEQVSTSAETPEVTELWTGTFTTSGDCVIFKGTQVEMMSDTGKVEEFKRETKAGNKEYCFQEAEEGRLLHLGEDGTPLEDPYPLKAGDKKYIYPQGGEVVI
ncbi:unnamed protein product [Symbiodinium sp. CCMP2592]|nr:unnamed protein product [Symbiodinium sp. CCMP2592]